MKRQIRPSSILFPIWKWAYSLIYCGAGRSVKTFLECLWHVSFGTLESALPILFSQHSFHEMSLSLLGSVTVQPRAVTNSAASNLRQYIQGSRCNLRKQNHNIHITANTPTPSSSLGPLLPLQNVTAVTYLERGCISSLLATGPDQILPDILYQHVLYF